MANSELDFWNQRYQKEGYLFGDAPNDFLKSQASLFQPGQSVLAVADGDGRNSTYLAGLGTNVTAFDFSLLAVEKSRLLAQEHGVEVSVEQRDLYTWQADGPLFDFVVAIFIQFVPPEKRPGVFRNMISALKPGGHLVMQGYRPEQLAYNTGGPPHAENMYTAALLEEAFAELEIIHLKEHDSVIEEGRGHSGMSALVDLVARKSR